MQKATAETRPLKKGSRGYSFVRGLVCRATHVQFWYDETPWQSLTVPCEQQKGPPPMCQLLKSGSPGEDFGNRNCTGKSATLGDNTICCVSSAKTPTMTPQNKWSNSNIAWCLVRNCICFWSFSSESVWNETSATSHVPYFVCFIFLTKQMWIKKMMCLAGLSVCEANP